MITIEDAILALVPNAEFVVYENKIIQWDSEGTQPTEDEIATKKTELQTEFESNEYQRDREAAYPALAEQFDKLWHDINNGTLDENGEFFKALKTVKDDNPKPSE